MGQPMNSIASPPAHLPQEIINAILKAKVISFDVFDTALVRATENPTDVFLLLAHEIGIDDIHAFAQARIEAETQARELAWQERKAAEISLNEIYSLLTNTTTLLTGYAPNVLMEHERALELRLCRRNPKVGEIFDWVISLSKIIVFISDMYLDAALIAEMLAKHNYSGYKFLWVSSAEGATKANGALFQLALNRLEISASDLVHIGDNLNSDIKQAVNQGILAYHIPKCTDYLIQAKNAKRIQRHLSRDSKNDPAIPKKSIKTSAIWKSLWRGLLAEHEVKSKKNFWFDLGYSHVGILLLGYALWLNNKMQQIKPTQVYFLARDGYIMHQVHQCLWERGWSDLSGQYLYASRRALNFPAMTAIDESTCDFLVSGVSRLTVSEFLTRIGIAPADYEIDIHKAGFTSADQFVLNGEDYGRLRMLFRLIAPRVIELAEKERDILHDYFQQEGLFGQQNIGIVDIGWHGTLQESISRLLKLYQYDIPITGFYLGTFSAAKSRVDAGAKQHAFIFEQGEPADRLSIVKTSIEVFEWIFCAPHGSVIGFEYGSEGIKPKFGSTESEQNRLLTSQQMQIGAMQFVRDALDCFTTLPPPISSDLALSLLKDLLMQPTDREASAIGNICHLEGFGNIEKARFIARPTERIYNPFAWATLLDDYRKSFWKAGYRRRMWPDCW